ncbi:MAG: transporter substrate-binding domain-containing protein [Halomonas sp.]|uniref:transporter substrate-binding domain-containing protein n=1 Tax=Halomonas sp. TaxID=1486246 RepID=UPI003F90ABDD
MFTKKIITMSATLLALTSPLVLGEEKLKLGVEAAYPPFNFTNSDGELAGFDIEIGNKLCEHMLMKCEWVTQQWDGMIPALKSGKFDVMISSMTITPERSEQVLFTDPYYFSYAMMAAPTGSGLELNQDHLSGKTIGLQAGTNHERWLPEKYGSDLIIRAYPSTDNMFLDFESGRLDAIFGDVAIIKPWINENGGKEAFEQIGENINDPSLGTEIGIAVRKNDIELATELNLAIEKIISDGSFKSIEKKYFNIELR